MSALRNPTLTPVRKALVGLAAATAIALAGCGSSSGGEAAGTTTGATTTTAAGATTGGLTLKSAEVGSLGKVLVDDQGRTLYILSSEAGGKVTCTDANGCTKAWPDVSLPDGTTAATAGDGLDASKLGTVKDGDETYPTYGGYPLYRFAGDGKAGDANGEGITSFGGTWTVVGVDGKPVAKDASGATPTTTY